MDGSDGHTGKWVGQWIVGLQRRESSVPGGGGGDGILGDSPGELHSELGLER